MYQAYENQYANRDSLYECHNYLVKVSLQFILNEFCYNLVCSLFPKTILSTFIGESWDAVKLKPPHPLPPTPSVIHYWPFQGGTFTVVLFVNCYVVFHFLMFFF